MRKKSVVLLILIGLTLTATTYVVSMLHVTVSRYQKMIEQREYIRSQAFAYTGLAMAISEIKLNPPAPGTQIVVNDHTDPDFLIDVTIDADAGAVRTYDVTVEVTYRFGRLELLANFIRKVMTSYELRRFNA